MIMILQQRNEFWPLASLLIQFNATIRSLFYCETETKTHCRILFPDDQYRLGSEPGLFSAAPGFETLSWIEYFRRNALVHQVQTITPECNLGDL